MVIKQQSGLDKIMLKAFLSFLLNILQKEILYRRMYYGIKNKPLIILFKNNIPQLPPVYFSILSQYILTKQKHYLFIGNAAFAGNFLCNLISLYTKTTLHIR